MPIQRRQSGAPLRITANEWGQIADTVDQAQQGRMLSGAPTDEGAPDEHGLFILGRPTQDLALGQWGYLTEPRFGATDRFLFDTLMQQGIPSQMGYPGHRGPLLGMAAEPIKANQVGRFQIAGVARTKVVIPKLPAGWKFSPHLAGMDMAHVTAGAKMPTATRNLNGQMDLIWLDQSAVDAEEDSEVAAVVRWPTVPRGPMLAGHKLRYYAYSAPWTQDMEIQTGSTVDNNLLNHPNYLGITAPFGERLIYFMRGGTYQISVHMLVAQASMPEDRGIMQVDLLINDAQSTFVGPGRFRFVVHAEKLYEPGGIGAIDGMGHSFVTSAPVSAGDRLALRVTPLRNISGIELLGAVSILGPLDHDYPATSAWSP